MVNLLHTGSYCDNAHTVAKKSFLQDSLENFEEMFHRNCNMYSILTLYVVRMNEYINR